MYTTYKIKKKPLYYYFTICNENYTALPEQIESA